MNAENTWKKLVKKTKNFFRKAGKKKAVLGLSGGIDSALALLVLKEALGAKNVFVLLMPEKGLTKEANMADAKKLAEKLGVKFKEIEISAILKPFKQLPWKQSRIAKANLKARSRMQVLYSYANSFNALVVGTGNKTELCLGYFTKHGDGACDVLPLGDLWKTEVRVLAKFKKLPETFLEKAPSAELFKGQTDEGEIGASYAEMDAALELLVEKRLSRQKILAAGVSGKTLSLVEKKMKESEHKRSMPEIIPLKN
ncbi:MAG: NAD+ synthase [Candidatus Diapherotrites archaeon]